MVAVEDEAEVEEEDVDEVVVVAEVIFQEIQIPKEGNYQKMVSQSTKEWNPQRVEKAKVVSCTKVKIFKFSNIFSIRLKVTEIEKHQQR